MKDQELREQFQAINGQFEMINRQLALMARQFERIDGRFDQVDARFDGIDARLDGIDGRLDGIDGRLDGIDGRLDQHDRRFDDMERDHAAAQAETRRHVDEKTSELRVQIEVFIENHDKRFDLLSEGLLMLNEKLDREAADIRGEMRRGFSETRDLIKYSQTPR